MGRMQRFTLCGAVLAALAACAQVPTPPPMPAQQCVADPARWAIGHEASAEVVERIRVDTHSAVAREIHPDDVITMEYSFQRVNVKVNERNAIVGITCGQGRQDAKGAMDRRTAAGCGGGMGGGPAHGAGAGRAWWVGATRGAGDRAPGARQRG